MTNPNKGEFRDKLKKDFNKKYKKYFPKITDKTRRLAIASFPDFVMELISIPLLDATSMIRNYEITVNGELVTDVSYQLKSGDVVRGDVGHRVNNSPFMAVVI